MNVLWVTTNCSVKNKLSDADTLIHWVFAFLTNEISTMYTYGGLYLSGTCNERIAILYLMGSVNRFCLNVLGMIGYRYAEYLSPMSNSTSIRALYPNDWNKYWI